jgi:hypothetical protein
MVVNIHSESHNSGFVPAPPATSSKAAPESTKRRYTVWHWMREDCGKPTSTMTVFPVPYGAILGALALIFNRATCTKHGDNFFESPGYLPGYWGSWCTGCQWEGKEPCSYEAIDVCRSHQYALDGLYLRQSRPPWLPRLAVNYHNELSRLLQRFGLTRRPSLALIYSLSVGQAMLLRTLLLTIMNHTCHSHDYRISAATQLDILALIDQLKRRIHKPNAIALFAAFSLPHVCSSGFSTMYWGNPTMVCNYSIISTNISILYYRILIASTSSCCPPVPYEST